MSNRRPRRRACAPSSPSPGSAHRARARASGSGSDRTPQHAGLLEPGVSGNLRARVPAVSPNGSGPPTWLPSAPPSSRPSKTPATCTSPKAGATTPLPPRPSASTASTRTDTDIHGTRRSPDSYSASESRGLSAPAAFAGWTATANAASVQPADDWFKRRHLSDPTLYDCNQAVSRHSEPASRNIDVTSCPRQTALSITGSCGSSIPERRPPEGKRRYVTWRTASSAGGDERVADRVTSSCPGGAADSADKLRASLGPQPVTRRPWPAVPGPFQSPSIPDILLVATMFQGRGGVTSAARQ